MVDRRILKQVDFTRPAGESALVSPDSVSWRVFKNPIALYVGGITAVLLELAEPRVRTGVWEHTTFRTDPIPRMERTGLAAMVTVYGARSEAERMIALPLRDAREKFEREYLKSQINRFGGNISRTAAFIGMERSALHRKLKSLGVNTSEARSDGELAEEYTQRLRNGEKPDIEEYVERYPQAEEVPGHGPRDRVGRGRPASRHEAWS